MNAGARPAPGCVAMLVTFSTFSAQSSPHTPRRRTQRHPVQCQRNVSVRLASRLPSLTPLQIACTGQPEHRSQGRSLFRFCDQRLRHGTPCSKHSASRGRLSGGTGVRSTTSAFHLLSTAPPKARQRVCRLALACRCRRDAQRRGRRAGAGRRSVAISARTKMTRPTCSWRGACMMETPTPARRRTASRTATSLRTHVPGASPSWRRGSPWPQRSRSRNAPDTLVAQATSSLTVGDGTPRAAASSDCVCRGDAALPVQRRWRHAHAAGDAKPVAGWHTMV